MNDPIKSDSPEGAVDLPHLVRQSLEEWIESGRGDECFWEGWPECPTEIELTPNMILAVLNSVPNIEGPASTAEGGNLKL
jgi:hypothetical protein